MINPLRWLLGERRDYSVSDDAVLQAFYGALSTTGQSGVVVTRESALRSTALLACLIVRAETHSALPADVVRLDGANRYPTPEDPVARLLAFSPNELMDSGDFWRWQDFNEDINGNAYARVEWKGMTPSAIWPLTGPKPTLHIDRLTRRVSYNYHGDEITPGNVYPAREILHFKSSVLTNPWEGRSLIDLASQAIGLTIASETFFSRLLANGNHFPGYLETDATLDEKDVKALKNQLSGFAGVLQAGVMRIFDRGLKYRQNSMSIKDMDLTPQMRWQLQQICSIFRVPLAMVQDLTNGTYANSEQQDLWLAKHTVTPMCVNKERTVRHRLLDPTRAFKFNLDALLRGDYPTRTAGDATLVNAGIISPDESRAHFDLNPVPGGENLRTPLNMGMLDEDGNVIPAPTASGPAPEADTEDETGTEDQVETEDEVDSEDQAEVIRSILAPITDDAAGWVLRRYEIGLKRGETYDDLVGAAAERLAPIVVAYTAAGLIFDPDAFVSDTVARVGQKET